MSPRRWTRTNPISEFRLDISHDDIVAALAYPGPPPGQWRVPPARGGQHTDHIDALLEGLERALWVQD